MKLELGIEDKNTRVLAAAAGEEEVWLVYEEEYREGDALILSGLTAKAPLILELDDALPPALVYPAESRVRYPLPWGEKKLSYSPRAFSGRRHLIHMRLPREGEIGSARRNLCLNPCDIHGEKLLFPHAVASVETRGESVFAARNAIDGCLANSFHGEWPYTSWGINQDPRARLKVEFGRPVLADSAVLYLRADFPHDAWWTSGVLSFSDGSRITVPLKKTGAAQVLDFSPRQVEWVALDSLIKADDPSPFPALTQLEIWGRG